MVAPQLQTPAPMHISPVGHTPEPLPQVPAVQVVPIVQASLSSQAPPSFAFWASHIPLVGLQTPIVQSPSSPVQSTALPPPHVPAVQVEPVVHMSLSSQAPPSLLFIAMQAPVV